VRPSKHCIAVLHCFLYSLNDLPLVLVSTAAMSIDKPPKSTVSQEDESTIIGNFGPQSEKNGRGFKFGKVTRSLKFPNQMSGSRCNVATLFLNRKFGVNID
jgi:hypothetical protein